MGFIGEFRTECPAKEQVTRHISGPCFAERSRKLEQHGTRHQRDRRATLTNDVPASIHHECFRCQQSFDFPKQDEPLLSTDNQACSGGIQDERCAFDFGHERGDACLARGPLRLSECGAGRPGSEAPHRDARNNQLVSGPGCGRKRRRVEIGERVLGLVEPADQEEAPDFEVAGMRSVDAVAVRFECRARRVEGLRRPAQIARGEGDLGLRHDAPRAGHRLFWTEGACSTPQEGLRSYQIAKLRHCDAAKSKGRRVVAQGDPLQRAEKIARRECARRGRDQRVHRNPATLVTPMIAPSGVKFNSRPTNTILDY